MNRLASRLCVLGLAASLSVGAASAGVSLRCITKSGGSSATSSMWIERDRLRIESAGSTAIYRADRDLVWLLNSAEGSYIEITKEQFKKVGEQLAGAMALLEQQVKEMPPEQRAMIEEMVKKAKPEAEAGEKPSGPITFSKVGDEMDFNGFTCSSWVGKQGETRVLQACVSDWKRFDITPKDFAVFELLGEFLQEGLGSVTKKFSTPLVQKYAEVGSPDALPGVPIRLETFGKGSASVTELERLKVEEFPPERFEVPTGYKKQELEAVPEK